MPCRMLFANNCLHRRLGGGRAPLGHDSLLLADRVLGPRPAKPYRALDGGKPPSNATEAVVLVIAQLILRMLPVATLDELIWLSRDVA